VRPATSPRTGGIRSAHRVRAAAASAMACGRLARTSRIRFSCSRTGMLPVQ